MVYIATSTHSFIVTLLTPLLCVSRTSCYNPLLITLMFFHDVLIHVMLYNMMFPSVETVSTISTLSVLYHYPIRFSCNLQFIPTTSPPSSLSGIVIPPNDVVWLSFDSIVHSLGSHLLSCPSSNVKHYMLEKNVLYFRIASYLTSHSSIHFTTLNQSFHHLHRLHHCRPLKSFLNPHLKPCNYVSSSSFPDTNPIITFMSVTT